LAGVSLAKADDPKVQLMFGQISDDMKADSTTLLGGGVGVGFHGAGAGRARGRLAVVGCPTRRAVYGVDPRNYRPRAYYYRRTRNI
jgi:hypothetical protein